MALVILGSKFPYIGQWSVDDVQIVTSRLAAKHVLYGADRFTESRIEANVEASVEQLKNLGDTLAEIDQVKIDGVLSQIESLGNVGVMGEFQQKVVPQCRWDELRDTAPQDVYLVMTEYDDLNRFASSTPRLHLSRIR